MTAKILVVDDEQLLEYVIQQRFRQKIRVKEIEFVFAHNGREALEKIAESPPFDLVLTDINMPEMDGLTLLEKLSEIDNTLKAVVISAYGDMQNIRTAMNRGAFDFLTKPIDFQDMEITIQRALEAVTQVRQNLTELQQAQTQLIQNEKMASVGQLVAGVAHEINNPISFILGNVEHAENYFQELITALNIYQKYSSINNPEIKTQIEALDLPFILEDLPQLLNSMKEGTERIRGISISLRTFSRADSTSKVRFNIHEGIDSSLLILRHRLKANDHKPEIQVIKDYGEIPPLECYPGQLNQVFLNIIANAIDALEEWNIERSRDEIKANPNKITIRTFLTDESEKMIEDNSTSHVIISIADNGMGMTEEVKQRVFNHLFTTKSVGKGTGLGLSISRSIIEEKHGGWLSCNSAPGDGTEFIIEIPT
ncbi:MULTISPECIES: hybrid sensor histidine kinase/response regulator [Kamptonema]|uniref:hybrid sensor histidine kinase/response regulator n=1 Tax=Kamptonema TaxID=1501433 RepID=UPI0001DAC62B|nr:MULTISPECIES: response regulator [Kamptonema]CBN53758.1 putative two-component hybrid sensor and regulator [Kamptonema sp. PCC 6506]